MRQVATIRMLWGAEVTARADDDLGLLVGIVGSVMARVGYHELSCSMAGFTLGRFVEFAAANGVTTAAGVSAQLAADFVMAPGVNGQQPAVTTRHHRRSVLRVFFRILHAFDPSVVDPTWALELPSRTTRDLRPVTDDELDVLRAVSVGTLAQTRQPSIVALAEAGAVTTEIARVVAADVDLGAGTVVLGPSRHAVARVAPLTGWGVVQLTRRIDHLDGADVALTYAGSGRTNAAQASISTNLRRLFTRAGLSAEADLGLASVRAWAGRRVLDQSGRIEDAARVLGCRSLDTAARIVGWDWRDP